MTEEKSRPGGSPTGTPGEVFGCFLRLGLTSFGGPIAHVGYFRREFVERRGWISDSEYAQLLGLCQFLPGPASSQMGFAVGLIRAGWAGAVAAFLAFTLPSALLMFAFAEFLPLDAGGPLENIVSTYHDIDIKQTDTHRYSIALVAEKVFAERDFELVWSPELGHEPQSVVFTQQHQGYEYALLSVLPPGLDSLGQQLLPRDVVFILDVSGSMNNPDKLPLLTSALRLLVGELRPQDRVAIVVYAGAAGLVRAPGDRAY